MIAWLNKFFFSLSFRTHLILLVLLLSVPGVVLISYSGTQQRKDSINEGIIETRMLVHSILTEQYNMTGDAVQLVSTLAQLADVKEHRVAATNAILSDIIKLNHQYGNIVIADRSGRIWASAIPFSRALTLQGSRAFDNAVRSRRFSAGEYGVGKISGKPNISFGYPIFDPAGGVNGVILASVDFGYLNDLLTESGLPGGCSFTLTDHNGVVIYRNSNSSEQIGTRIQQNIFRQMRGGADEVSFLDSALARGKMITSYGQLRLRGERTPYLYLKAGIPLHHTLVKARRAELINVAVLSPVLLVAVLLASLLAKFCFVNRIRRLQEASQRLAGGDLESGLSAFAGGGELGELARSFDEMAQKLATRERALLLSEAELNDLYNDAPCGYHSLDLEGYFVRVNDTELSWLGYSRDRMIGRMKFVELLNAEERERYRESLRQLRERGRLHDLEYDLVRADGSLMPVLLNATAVYAEDGSLLMTRSTIYDITERKQAERALEELNRTLAQRVESETEKRLQQERLLARHARLAAIGEMIGAIAHQWRQPLATLGAVIQSIRMAWEYRSLDGKFLERAEADAQKQLYYMSDTIEDFRNFFSPEKVVELFDVREKIEEVSLLVAAQFANSGVALQVVDDAAGEPLRIKGYQNEFKQSVLNLVSNAFDAIVIKGAERGEVAIALGRGEASVVIEVRDNGCGIAPEIAEKIWEPYFTSKTDGKGTGIGLYMSKLIVEESMGGSLGFRCSPEGTVFRIVLPQNER